MESLTEAREGSKGKGCPLPPIKIAWTRVKYREQSVNIEVASTPVRVRVLARCARVVPPVFRRVES